MQRKWIALLPVLGFLAHCSSPGEGPLTREDSLVRWERLIQITHKTYAGVTRDDVLFAADKLFRSADDQSLRQRTEDGLLASRRLSNGEPHGPSSVANWFIKTEETPEGVKVTARAVLASSPVVQKSGTGELSDYPTVLPPAEDLVQSEALYGLFFAQLDHLLRKSDRWVSCEDADPFLMDQGLKGSVEALCKDEVKS